MTREECQEKIARVLCGKGKDITCEECFKMSRGKICSNLKTCRISEKSIEQLNYVLMSIDENTFLKACAGSGKTEVVGMKAAYEIKQWQASSNGIAILSFTNEAVNIIKNRISQFIGKNSTYPHYIGTLSSFIHSYIVQPFAYKYVDFEGKQSDYSFSVVDERMSVFSNYWLKDYKCSIPYLSSKGGKQPIYAHQLGYDFIKKDFYFYVGKTIVWFDEYYKSERIQEYIKINRLKNPNSWKYEDMKTALKTCKKKFLKHGFANFDDLNYLAIKVLRVSGCEVIKRFPYIFIDECQDLSGNELEVLRLLEEKGCFIHLIGDLNQSIYEFKRVEPDEVKKHTKNFRDYYLKYNFRSCKEIVDFSERLINQTVSKSQNVESKFASNSLIYIEYCKPEEVIEKYVKLLESLKFSDCDNKILVKQNSLRKSLEKSTQNELDTKEPLIIAVQLWREKTPKQMTVALELAGLQISKWFNGGRMKKNYYCPKDINSVFAWRIYIMNVLDSIEGIKVLMNFDLTYGEWHEYARDNLNDILKSHYEIIKKYDVNKNRNMNEIVNGHNFKVSTGKKNVKINVISKKTIPDIPILTIHGSKGCTYDSVLVISSENTRSEGGHWKTHWIEGKGEVNRIGYVASTRAKYLLVWGIPSLKNDEDKKLIESYGFVSSDKIIV